MAHMVSISPSEMSVHDAVWDLQRVFHETHHRIEALLEQVDDAVERGHVPFTNARLDLLDAATVAADGIDPNAPTVYTLWGADGQRLYIGKSCTPFSRVSQHLKDGARRAAVKKVTLAACESVPHMNDLERELIARHEPPWNVQIPRTRIRATQRELREAHQRFSARSDSIVDDLESAQ